MPYASQLPTLWREILQDLENDPTKVRGPFLDAFNHYYRKEQELDNFPVRPDYYQFKAEEALWKRYRKSS
jgi:hypothetical protein